MRRKSGDKVQVCISKLASQSVSQGHWFVARSVESENVDKSQIDLSNRNKFYRETNTEVLNSNTRKTTIAQCYEVVGDKSEIKLLKCL